MNGRTMGQGSPGAARRRHSPAPTQIDPLPVRPPQRGTYKRPHQRQSTLDAAWLRHGPTQIGHRPALSSSAARMSIHTMKLRSPALRCFRQAHTQHKSVPDRSDPAARHVRTSTPRNQNSLGAAPRQAHSSPEAGTWQDPLSIQPVPRTDRSRIRPTRRRGAARPA